MSISRTRRRIGIAGATAALLTSAALGMGAASPGSAYADEVTPSDGAAPAGAEAVPVDASAEEPAPSDASETGAATVSVGIPGTYAASESQAALDRINAIRAEAAAEGITVDGAPVSGAPLLQSSGLEYVAQVRTAECSFSPCAAANGLRPNGQGSVAATDASANSLAGYAVKAEFAGQGGISGLVDQWYQEKDAYLAYLATGEATGEFSHYAALISDAYVYAGISSFTSALDGTTWYAVELAATPSESLDVFGEGAGVCQIDVLPEGNLNAIIIVPDGIDRPPAGTTVQLAASVTSAVTGADLTPYLDLTWVSNDEAILSVDQSGLLTTVGEGIANIAIYQGDVALASFNLRVSAAQIVSAAVAPDRADVATPARIAPTLPATAQVTWTDGSVTEEPVTWDAIDPCAYATAGSTFTVCGVTQTSGLPVSCTVSVGVPAAISVTAPAAVETASGSAPVLPQSVHAVLSDGTETDLPVTWDEVDPASYSPREGGSFEVSGTVEGWGEPVAVTVSVLPATVSGIAQPAAVSTETGTAPVLPATVQVTWSNGDVTDEAVTWGPVDPSSYAQEGTFSVAGTVGTDGSLGTATCPVTVVKPAPTVVGFIQPADVVTESGTAPELPATVTVTWSDGSETDEEVHWSEVDPASYTAREGGTFWAGGTVDVWQGGEVGVDVVVNPATISSVEGPAAVSTPSGTAPELPATVRAAWSNGDETDEAVAWDEVDPASYAAREGGGFEVSGTVAGWAEPVVVEVEVEPATMTEIENPAGVSTVAGEEPALPATAQAVWSNGDKTEEPVAWDAVEAESYAQAGTFEATGTVSSAGGTLTVSCTVTVEASPATIVDVEDPSVSTASGTAPLLPDTVQATWSDGSTTDVGVTWEEADPASYSPREGGSFEVSGTVEGWDGTVTARVTVEPATMTGVESPAAVSTPSGTAPALPATIEATWSNGDVTDEAVAWEEPDPASYSPREGGSFEVSGTVEGWDGTVTARVTVEPATISSVEGPAAVSTPSGTAPELPAAVEATWSNGDVTDEAVAWEEPDPASYSPREGGSFEVSGAVEGWDGAVTVTVSVEPATISSVEGPAAVSTPSGTAPELPTTVQVTWSNGDETNESVAWGEVDPASYAAREGGSFEVEGTVEGWAEPVVAEVAVEPATIEALSTAEVQTPAGIAPELPATVEATWSNGDVTDEAVAWDEVDAPLVAQPGTFTVEGSVGATRQVATCTVNVGEPVVSDVADPEPIETYAGAEPALPATASVTWSDGSVTDEAVTWSDVDPASYAEVGSFEVPGTVDNTDRTVDAEVSVRAMRIVGIVPAAVSTPAGVAPELPATVEATWEDGSTTSEPVTWETVDPTAYATQGSSFEVAGTLDGSSEVADASPVAEVSVAEPVATGVADVPTVETPAGVAPELPATVPIAMSDGSTVEEEVVWNAVDPASYRTEGSFAVEGTAGGFEASVDVDVSAPLAVNAQNVSVTTTTGTAPKLPETVQVTWSNGTVTSEDVSWPACDESWYTDPGMFRMVGSAAGLDVAASVTVRTENLGIDQNGDGTTAAVAVGAGAVGIAAVAGAISALVARFHKKP